MCVCTGGVAGCIGANRWQFTEQWRQLHSVVDPAHLLPIAQQAVGGEGPRLDRAKLLKEGPQRPRPVTRVSQALDLCV
jgi:hypothetical protein